MIIKDKNKSKLEAKSKILVLGLILLVLAGLFSPAREVQAQVVCTSVSNGRTLPAGCTVPPGSCFDIGNNPSNLTWQQCNINPGYRWLPPGQTPTGPVVAPSAGGLAPGTTARATAAASVVDETEFQREIGKNLCWVGFLDGAISPIGCVVQFSYIIFYTIPAYLLWAAAQFFNVLIFITLGSQLLDQATFISAGWKIVRDLSNIFFILILLYIAVKTILGIGGSEVKKIIVNVIITALLINFSMFMTKVVIDTSNILALVFYNKLEVKTVDSNGQPVSIAHDPILASTFGVEKNIAGAMTAAFDPTSLLTADFFRKAGEQCSGIPGTSCTPGSPSAPILIGITIVAGTLMFFAAYSFFVAGISFVGRLIELWVLIIGSPFAFMSFSLPILAGVEYVGWDSWHKRLLKVSFMAPIFMFFMYFIFLLLQQGNPFGNVITSNGGVINTILLVVIPTIVILTLLLKATEFAKKGGGKLGEFASTAGKMIGGLAVGAATGGTALALRAGVGGVGGWAANKAASRANRLGLNKMASGLTSVGALAQRSSFDIRGVKIGGQTLASATGIPMGEAQKGGIAQARKDKVEKRMKRAEMLKMREDEGLKQALNKEEIKLQEILNINIKSIEEKDKAIAEAKETMDPVLIKAAIADKKAHMTSLGVDTIKQEINKIKNNIDIENRRRTTTFANRKGGWGILSSTANKEARHNIIMGSKIESKGNPN
ncbi:hypothetical protein A3A05_01020 [Candidatus Nomurabacteria bacterium RIFCSPLOWO2_01_FULL_41_12]|uniref:Uncharacterized protein n=1 Tax=Candidatus Nomurabacteria bacterium RIFCSPLOWO2_01_FULL_41_12 TaxID=1801774 RepID=A0A1F6WV00_9BACT|nr:MAG: hypothetical protein A3A05_01020 [Candidatus Nomurabacteria bacterium RIFCSPLOWO2_01_FULL_41_12]